ncbi:MAG TPA: hypothetical protein DIC56_18185 [Rhizobium sp.]|nr:hypothetical protein [Rhizobium sp.]
MCLLSCPMMPQTRGERRILQQICLIFVLGTIGMALVFPFGRGFLCRGPIHEGVTIMDNGP